MPSKIRTILLIGFAVAAYALTAWGGRCERCVLIDPATQATGL